MFNSIKVICVCALACAAGFAQETNAGTERPSAGAQRSVSPCKQLVLNFSNEVISIKNSKLPEKEAKARFVDIVNRYVAVENISKFLLAANYKKLTDDEKKKVQKCVTNLMAVRLLAKLPYGSSITTNIKDEKSLPNKHWLVTVEYAVNEKRYEVVFSIFDRQDRLKIFDVVVDKVSASQIQRADIGGNIAKVGFKQFLADFFKTYEH